MKATRVQANAKAETVTLLNCQRIGAVSKYEPDIYHARQATPQELAKLASHWQSKRH